MTIAILTDCLGCADRIQGGNRSLPSSAAWCRLAKRDLPSKEQPIFLTPWKTKPVATNVIPEWCPRAPKE